MNGEWLTWRTAGFTLAAVLVTVVASSILDLANSIAGQTHLARFAGDVLQGHAAAAAQLTRRKLENNLAFLPQTDYTGLAIAMVAALALGWFVRRSAFRRALELTPAYSGALVGIVVGSVVALASEDSGVVMPALMLFAGAAPALLVTLRDHRERMLARQRAKRPPRHTSHSPGHSRTRRIRHPATRR